MRKIAWEGPVTADRVSSLLPRADLTIEKAMAETQILVNEVRTKGQAALLSHAEKFDGVRPESLRISSADLRAAAENLEPELREAIQISIERVRKVSEANIPKNTETVVAEGAMVLTRYQPIESVGVYVPGGKAVYPSSVVMNVVAAQAAGVNRIALASPAQKSYDGKPHPTILATAHLLGVTEVYSMGGASAVAAFAFGVKEMDLEPVRMVTGPGNIYVASAKRLLRGVIGIDSEAGPTEILIIADSTANPDYIAADLISQAEHDENAAAVLVTDSEQLIASVERSLERQIQKTANRSRVEIALSGAQSALVLSNSLAQSIEIANEYATEHLEIQTQDPEEVARRISNAGAIFLGDFSPVSLGDYLAGSNHVLPTGQQAKFGPGLGPHTFLRPQQIVSYTKLALEAVTKDLETFANAEGLSGHGDASRIRFS
ncbi:MAG: histidinol dehydrogenase [Actinomycetota bacterium]